jgi:hypothetical protein
MAKLPKPTTPGGAPKKNKKKKKKKKKTPFLISLEFDISKYILFFNFIIFIK